MELSPVAKSGVAVEQRMEQTLGSEQGQPLARALFGTRAAGIAIVDAEGRIEVANPRLGELLHSRAEELRGQPVDALLPGVWAAEFGAVRIDAQCPGGWSVPVTAEVTLLGDNRRAIVHVLDAAEQAAADRTRSQLQFWRATAHALDVPLAIVNRMGAIGWVNDAFCRLAGYAEHELVGLPYFTFLEGEDAIDQRRTLSQLIRVGGHSLAQRVHWRNARGAPREITMRHLACADGEGDIRWVVLAGIDAAAFSD